MGFILSTDDVDVLVDALDVYLADFHDQRHPYYERALNLRNRLENYTPPTPEAP